jgi:hypothetical protein
MTFPIPTANSDGTKRRFGRFASAERIALAYVTVEVREIDDAAAGRKSPAAASGNSVLAVTSRRRVPFEISILPDRSRSQTVVRATRSRGMHGPADRKRAAASAFRRPSATELGWAFFKKYAW